MLLIYMVSKMCIRDRLCGVLPEEDAVKGDKEEITLIPMGAARLRISAFPNTKE